ncbi:sulfur oxidation c-type cytochrome SoxA, partial [Ralstonia pseudosolanacearum]
MVSGRGHGRARRLPVAGGAAAAEIATAASTEAAAALAQYRQMLADGNPAELWEAAGE